MKFAIVLLGLVSLAFSAPQPRKVFHENVEDFLNLINDVAGEELFELMEHYAEFEEFWVSINYLTTADFKNLVYEMESLPEFKAVIDFLEKDNIDIMYFIDRFNFILEEATGPQGFKKSRHQLSGRDFNSFINDCVAALPKDQLAALFDQKLAEDEEFRVAIENLYSEEWAQIYDALWKSEQFQVEIRTLAEHGIEINVLLNELFAVFGQN
ncbi:uncharacterized protein LOC106129135 [Amyelois transitella]|uniref:uncharacterized protein LOC106129135 n=1 Tax=Amyelois transitella TaxID=680683 RepID=UPI00299043F1|nr:uncharacterized protein LOC106129135 [Amyelois transitella]